MQTGGHLDMLSVLLLLCVGTAVWGTGRIQDRQGPAAAPLCPSPCQCEEDEIFVMVDCSELGLSSVPANLSPLTTYLDLSMNNISEIHPRAFHGLHLLSELRISGNQLRYISGHVLQGLYNLKVLMLQNNQLERLPDDAPWDLPNLLSLRLDANLLSEVPAGAFRGVRSLRHLWLDDNSLTEIPVTALDSLPSLQAMTLALNQITHIPDYAFTNLSALVVLHLHNNQIQSMGARCFEGLHSLETLDLNYNYLQEFPVAIRTLSKLQELGFHNNNIKAIPERAFVGNPLLQTIHFYENPIQFVGKSAFQFLPKLHTLSLNGATQIQEFPDLKGTTSLEILTLTRAGLSALPLDLCEQLPRLRVLELSYNHIEDLQSFYHCSALQEIGLQHNQIRRIESSTFQQLASLRALDLSWNMIEWIHPDAFTSLHSLIKLDLTENRLSSIPVMGLGGLTHLKLRGNTELYEAFSPDHFPHMRVIEMPYAYQCCVYGSCDNYKPANQWDTEQSNTEEDLHKRTVAMYPIHTDTHYDPDLEEFQLEIEESKLQTSVQCTPTPGPFRPCDSLLGSWLVRVGLWSISLVSLLGNSLLLLSLFGSPGYLSPLRFTVACMGASNLLTGVCTCTLALVDALTLGEFGHHGARWEGGPGCQATGWVWVFASEASVLLLTLAAVQCGVSVTCARAYGKSPSLGSVRTCALFCLALSITLASLPVVGIGEYGSSPFCLPSPLPPTSSQLPSSLAFPLALIMMNTLCLLIVTGSYIRLYWELLRGECEGLWDCAMIKHVAWLIFTNGLLYIPVAFLSLCSLLGLLSLGEEVLKSVLLLLQPLPACLNPLLFLLFTRDHTQCFFWPRPKARPQLRRDRTLDSLVSVETEKSSCSDSLTQVSLAEADGLCSGGSSRQSRLDPIRFSHCSSSSSVPLIPCQIPTPTTRDRDKVTEHESLNDEECLRSLDQEVIHNTCPLYHSTMTSSLPSHP
ncbi:leucine-rich repeat-containing G-protein coupled receptor 6 isoform X1 [Mastacembelus armatus]|uniref:leucine-rich repeat-containing G-protein coupled receptor 6 isoform X1 n=2 Tax=Mastacembelus armatus TaxID=205130 RepID=UPI000E459AC0|nr:leucine-rich repeat-containing G-protein coupled receptor 6 isoform X1 [Mastacembelus armatus]